MMIVERMVRPTVPGPTALVVGLALSLGWGQSPLIADSPTVKPTTALDDYLGLDQPDFSWKLDHREPLTQLTRLELTLTSQRWHDTVWRHNVRIFWPAEIGSPGAAILYVNGGANGRDPGVEHDASCLALAMLSQMPVVALFQVPNQPLLGDRYEDELIAETWLRYLRTEDATWPLLLPMVNSAVKAMDCVNEVCQQEFETPVTQFIITGASKRGWTSWLTAATEPRIIGTAPMVIDTLNFRAQIRDQHEKWGYFSEQIDDYTRAGLVKLEDESPQDTQLRLMMDPYSYRDRLTVPKLIINGTNDRYWRCDAIQNYWSGLTGPKNVLNIPNAGHSLRGGYLQVTATVAAFAKHCAAGKTLPNVEWDYDLDDSQRQIQMRVRSSEPARQMSFWVAMSPTRDFREARWTERAADTRSATTSEIAIEVPAQQHVAVFGDLTIGPLLGDYHLSTGVVQPSFEDGDNH